MNVRRLHDSEPGATVDVIILSWNRVEDTIAAIESAGEQRGVQHRIYVVDQGSDAPNLQQLEEFVRRRSGVTLHKLSQNSGVAGGRNIATSLGSAPYIVALDSDAIFADRDTLARAVAHMDANPRLCAIGFRITNFFTRRNDDTSWDYAPGRSPDTTFLTTRFIGAGHAIRRSTFETVGAYDATLFFCGEERDLCYRMLNQGMRIEYVHTVEVLHKVSPEHRVFWGGGRYYYTVRNTLYSLYKYGEPLPRILRAAAAFLLRGAVNGIAGQACRGIVDSVGMCRNFRRSGFPRDFYRMRPATVDYIAACETERSLGWVERLRRQFTRLPQQSAPLRDTLQ